MQLQSCMPMPVLPPMPLPCPKSGIARLDPSSPVRSRETLFGTSIPRKLNSLCGVPQGYNCQLPIKRHAESRTQSNTQFGGREIAGEYAAYSADTTDGKACNQCTSRQPNCPESILCTSVAPRSMFPGIEWLVISQSPDQRIPQDNRVGSIMAMDQCVHLACDNDITFLGFRGEVLLSASASASAISLELKYSGSMW
jgi:hypothetical protein